MRVAILPEAREQHETKGAGFRYKLAFVILLLLQVVPSVRQQAFCQGEAANDSQRNGQSTTSTATTEPDSKNATDSANTAGRHMHKYKGPARPYGYYLNPILEHVKASEDQRSKITAIVQSFRGRIQPLREEYRQKNQEFLSDIAKGQTQELIMNEQTYLSRLHGELTLNYCQMSLEVRKILSPEQIVLYEEFKRKQGWASSKQQAVH